jgi:uncharacterized cupredoxin-like copper-binding protein
MKSKLMTLLLALAVVALTAAGCGSDNNNSSGSGTSGGGGYSKAPASSASTATTDTQAQPTTSSGGTSAPSGRGSEVKLSADPSGALKFDKSALSAKAGTVTLVMDNPSPVPHAVGVEGNGVDKDGNIVNKGGVSKVSVDLKPGVYTFYCPVPGHRQGGMVGKLTVK